MDHDYADDAKDAKDAKGAKGAKGAKNAKDADDAKDANDADDDDTDVEVHRLEQRHSACSEQIHHRIYLPATRTAVETNNNERSFRCQLVIFVHGWAQNVRVFRNRNNKLTNRFLNHGIDCLFLNAPMHLPPLNDAGQASPSTRTSIESNSTGSDSQGRQDAYAWFCYDAQNPTDRSLSQSGQELHYIGIETSLQLLQYEVERVSTTSTNITLLGFSQGAVLCHVVAALKERSAKNIGRDDWCHRIQRCIFVGGFPATPSNWQMEHESLRLRNLTQMRSLHVIGLQDTSVPPPLSHNLVKCFSQNVAVLEHSKGHVVPQHAEASQEMVDFIVKGR